MSSKLISKSRQLTMDVVYEPSSLQVEAEEPPCQEHTTEDLPTTPAHVVYTPMVFGCLTEGDQTFLCDAARRCARHDGHKLTVGYGTASSDVDEDSTHSEVPLPTLRRVLADVMERPSDVSQPEEELMVVVRGLENAGNMCFLNVVLQSLVGCTPFYNLLKHINNRMGGRVELLCDEGLQESPMLTAMLTLFDMFQYESLTVEEKTLFPTPIYTSSNPTITIVKGHSITPEMLYPHIRHFAPDYYHYRAAPVSWPSLQNSTHQQQQQSFTVDKRNSVPKGGKADQEDAQEFLSYVLDKLHVELKRVCAFESNGVDGEGDTAGGGGDDDDGWHTIGPGQTVATSTVIKADKSFITDIFGGGLRSLVRCKGSKPSITFQPFRVLHVDIQVHTLLDALRTDVFAPEVLDDYITSNGLKGTATKQLSIASLPQILVLQLKRFSFSLTTGAPVKVHKPISYPLMCRFDEFALCEWGDGASGGGEVEEFVKPKEYKLLSVISHHGKAAAGGHYTCHIRKPGDRWIRFDDSRVRVVTVDEVLNNETDAYVLFYELVARDGDGDGDSEQQ